jgi:hypothetical protein
MRRSRVALAVLVVVLLTTAGSCLREAKPVGQQASTWLPKVERYFSETRAQNVFQRLQLGDEAARARPQQLIKEAPKTLSPEETAALNRLRGLRIYYATVDDAVRAIEFRWTDVDTIAQTVTTNSLTVRVKPEVIDHLTQHAKSILRDVACGLAWKFMNPAEQQVVVDKLYGQGYTNTFVDEIKGLASMTLQEAVNAIASAGTTAFLKIYNTAAVVDWGSYAYGLYEKGKSLVGDGEQTITYPNGAASSRAMVYYARICLKPPGS